MLSNLSLSECIPDIPALFPGSSASSNLCCNCSVRTYNRSFERQTKYNIKAYQFDRTIFYSRLHTSSKRLADLPPSDRPSIGASSIFENLEKDTKVEDTVGDKTIPHEEREVSH